MSPQGRPKGESRSAQREGDPISPQGRPGGACPSGQREVSPMFGPGHSKAATSNTKVVR